jgi:hypothetical protein
MKMSLLDALTNMLNKEHGEEIIDGGRVEDAAKCVDLSIAYSPVVDQYIGTIDIERMMLNPSKIPQPIKPRKDGLRYYTADPRAQTWQWFTPEQMKTARARYLLLRGYFYKHIGGFAYNDQQRVVAWYFEGGVWRPNPGTELGNAMGIVA